MLEKITEYIFDHECICILASDRLTYVLSLIINLTVVFEDLKYFLEHWNYHQEERHIPHVPSLRLYFDIQTRHLLHCALLPSSSSNKRPFKILIIQEQHCCFTIISNILLYEIWKRKSDIQYSIWSYSFFINLFFLQLKAKASKLCIPRNDSW